MKINLIEELNKRDKESFNKYDLLNTYKSTELKEAKRSELIKLLAKGEGNDKIAKLFNENWCEDKLDELKKKPKAQWDEDDWDAYNYCMNVNAESDYADMNESKESDVTLYTFDETLESLNDNMSQEDIDKFLITSNRIARALGTKADKLICLPIYEDYLEPSGYHWIDEYKNITVRPESYLCTFKYNGEVITCVEEIGTSIDYLWFKTESDAKKYISAVDSDEMNNFDEGIHSPFSDEIDDAVSSSFGEGYDDDMRYDDAEEIGTPSLTIDDDDVDDMDDNVFYEDGAEYKVVDIIKTAEGPDDAGWNDVWQVIDCINTDTNEHAYFVRTEDGFIDWGPVDTADEAVSWLDNKWNEDDSDEYDDDYPTFDLDIDEAKVTAKKQPFTVMFITGTTRSGDPNTRTGVAMASSKEEAKEKLLKQFPNATNIRVEKGRLSYEAEVISGVPESADDISEGKDLDFDVFYLTDGKRYIYETGPYYHVTNDIKKAKMFFNEDQVALVSAEEKFGKGFKFVEKNDIVSEFLTRVDEGIKDVAKDAIKQVTNKIAKPFVKAGQKVADATNAVKNSNTVADAKAKYQQNQNARKTDAQKNGIGGSVKSKNGVVLKRTDKGFFFDYPGTTVHDKKVSVKDLQNKYPLLYKAFTKKYGEITEGISTSHTTHTTKIMM